MRISDWSSDVCSSDLRGAVEPNRICRQPVRTDGKFSCLRQMALLLTVPVNGSPGERAYARADKGARGPVAIAPDDLITQQPAGNSAQDRAACNAVATIDPDIAPVTTPEIGSAPCREGVCN